MSVTGESMCTKYWLNRLGGLSLPGKSVVRLIDRPDMTLDVYRERKTTIQQHFKQEYYIDVEKQDNVCVINAIVKCIRWDIFKNNF